MKKLAQKLLYMLVLLPLVAQAAEVKDLYETTVPVMSQKEDERTASLGIALSQVLVKVSGDGQVMTLPGMLDLLGEAPRLMLQYRYLAITDEVELKKAQGWTQSLWVRFDKEGVNQLLFENGLPVWGHTRPSVLLWVAVAANDGERFLLNSGREDELNGVVKAVEARRGIPLVLPLQDLEEQSEVSFIDVWGNFRDRIISGAARYQADVVVTARLFFERGEWVARWTILKGLEMSGWESTAKEAEESLADGLNLLADGMARQYAQLMGEQEGNVIWLAVEGVADLAAYVRVKKYLDSLSNVLSVKASEVSANKVMFRLEVRGGRDGVFQAISLGKTLQGDAYMTKNTPVWLYQLRP